MIFFFSLFLKASHFFAYFFLGILNYHSTSQDKFTNWPAQYTDEVISTNLNELLNLSPNWFKHFCWKYFHFMRDSRIRFGMGYFVLTFIWQIKMLGYLLKNVGLFLSFWVFWKEIKKDNIHKLKLQILTTLERII